MFAKISYSYLCDRGQRSHYNSLLCIHEDVDDTYKWPTFWPSSLHQHQILHTDDNITNIHVIYRVFIEIITSNFCIVINGRGFVRLEINGESSTDRRFLNSSLTARRSLITSSIYSLWSSSRWHHSSSICRGSWPISRPQYGPRW